MVAAPGKRFANSYTGSTPRLSSPFAQPLRERVQRLHSAPGDEHGFSIEPHARRTNTAQKDDGAEAIGVVRGGRTTIVVDFIVEAPIEEVSACNFRRTPVLASKSVTREDDDSDVERYVLVHHRMNDKAWRDPENLEVSARFSPPPTCQSGTFLLRIR